MPGNESGASGGRRRVEALTQAEEVEKEPQTSGFSSAGQIAARAWRSSMRRRRRCGCGGLGLPNKADLAQERGGEAPRPRRRRGEIGELRSVTDEGEDAHAPLPGRTLQSVDAEGAEGLRPAAVATALALRLVGVLARGRRGRLRDDAPAQRARACDDARVADRGNRRRRDRRGRSTLSASPSHMGAPPVQRPSVPPLSRRVLRRDADAPLLRHDATRRVHSAAVALVLAMKYGFPTSSGIGLAKRIR